jgi:hypothetical protein
MDRPSPAALCSKAPRACGRLPSLEKDLLFVGEAATLLGGVATLLGEVASLLGGVASLLGGVAPLLGEVATLLEEVAPLPGGAAPVPGGAAPLLEEAAMPLLQVAPSAVIGPPPHHRRVARFKHSPPTTANAIISPIRKGRSPLPATCMSRLAPRRVAGGGPGMKHPTSHVQTARFFLAS